MATSDRSRPQLNQSFFKQDSITIARLLIGKRLVRLLDGHRLSGLIVETEAYCPNGVSDLACHASKNNGQPTSRTRLMFGPAGIAYVYFNYGIHWLFNVVVDGVDRPGAVLVRALEPVEGIEFMRERRKNRPISDLTNGPAKLTQAMQIGRNENGVNLCEPNSVIWIEDNQEIDKNMISEGPRIGLGKTPEPWNSIPWRFWLQDNPYVSK